MLLSPRDKQALVQSLWTGWNDGGAALEQFPKTIKAILDSEAWRDREVDGRSVHNNTFREFIVVPPLKGCGWGKQIDAIDRLLNLKAPDIAGEFRTAFYGTQGSRNDLVELPYNVQKLDSGKGGNSASYVMARLQRDYPALAHRVVTGELSANAAALQAGFRKNPSPYEQVVKLIPKLSAAEREELRSML